MLDALENTPFMQEYRRIDHWLVVNHPRLWVLRLPYLALYFLIFNIVGIALFWFFANQIHHALSAFSWLFLVALVELAFLILWLRKFNDYSPEKALENTNPFMGWIELLSYIACIIILFSPTLTIPAVLLERFDQMIDINELYQDQSVLRNLQVGEDLWVQLGSKYLGIPASEFAKMSQNELRQANRDIGASLSLLTEIKEDPSKFYGGIFQLHLILTHIAAFMFMVKHAEKNVPVKVFVYIVVLYIVILITFGIISLFSYLLNWNIAEDDLILKISFFSLLLITIFAAGGFWQKRRREFTVLNIVALPVAIYLYLAFWDNYDYAVTDFLGKYFQSQTYDLTTLFFLSPLPYILFIPIIKIFFIRYLSQPEN